MKKPAAARARRRGAPVQATAPATIPAEKRLPFDVGVGVAVTETVMVCGDWDVWLAEEQLFTGCKVVVGSTRSATSVPFSMRAT